MEVPLLFCLKNAASWSRTHHPPPAALAALLPLLCNLNPSHQALKRRGDAYRAPMEIGIRKQETKLLRRASGFSVCYNATNLPWAEGLIGLGEFQITLKHEVASVCFFQFTSPTPV